MEVLEITKNGFTQFFLTYTLLTSCSGKRTGNIVMEKGLAKGSILTYSIWYWDHLTDILIYQEILSTCPKRNTWSSIRRIAMCVVLKLASRRMLLLY